MDESMEIAPLYSFNANFQKRNFVGNRIGPILLENVAIIGDTTDELLNLIWAHAMEGISREVVIDKEGKCSWHEKEIPTTSDIDKFILIQDKVSRKLHQPSKIVAKTWTGFRNKEIDIFVHQYSRSIGSAATFSQLSAQLLVPENRDRAGANTNIELLRLSDELKELHGNKFQGESIAWSMWANFIHKSKPNERESLMNERFPPDHIIKHFRTVPTAEATRLDSARHGIVVAQNVNRAQQTDISAIRDAMNTFKETVLFGLEVFDRRLQAIEHRVSSEQNLIAAMDNSLAPVESEFSKGIREDIPDQEDLDHN